MSPLRARIKRIPRIPPTWVVIGVLGVTGFRGGAGEPTAAGVGVAEPSGDGGPVPEIRFDGGEPTLSWFASRGFLYRIAFLGSDGVGLHDCGQFIAGDDAGVTVQVADLLSGRTGALTFFQISASTDADRDAMADDWEIAHLGSSLPAPGEDADGAGLDNGTEFRGGTLPGAVDSDGDGWNDGFELAVGSDPMAGPTAPDPGDTGLVLYRRVVPAGL